MRIFISWSKNKSKKLAHATKKFLSKVLNGSSIEFFFSPEMYKGTRVDNEIHANLLNSDKCIVCITSENFKNPWLLYEAGVIYGRHYADSEDGVVIPILFENIPEWSSWVDKPLNRYVPIQIQTLDYEFSAGKESFKIFLKQLSENNGFKILNFDDNWDEYQNTIKNILLEEQIIPVECLPLVNALLKDSSNFTLTSPVISKEKIYFHKGFTTHALTKILIDQIQQYQGKYLWFYGRKNFNLIMTREFEPFFAYLASEGLANGVDFRCLFVHPKSDAAIKSSSKDRNSIFEMEMHNVLKLAYNLKKKYNLPVEKVFKLYTEPRTESIIRCDNTILYRNILCDSEGYPLPYTNSGFEVLSAVCNNESKSNKGFKALKKYDSIWNDDEKTIPLTEKLLIELYGDNY